MPGKISFKEYQMDQPLLLPPSLEELVPENHLVRIVNKVIENMNLTNLLKEYKGGGNSSYHPKMMLKVIIYAYTQKHYSCREIAKALRENIHFMWLSAANKPDFRTINLFRQKLKKVIFEIFFNVVHFLEENNLIQLKNYFLDGTKIEANANKYSFVWKKSTEHYMKNLKKKVKTLLTQIDEYDELENKKYGSKDLPEMGEDSHITADMLAETVQKIDQALSDDGKKKDLKKVASKIKKDILPRLKRYEEYQQKLGKRNSFSKTDTDATFMRMKDDHMKNGQLKPAYNVQIGTENQFIVGYSLHQKTTDTSFLIPHLKHLKKHLSKKVPENIVADAGYGSEENYVFLGQEKYGNYVKYNLFQKEQTRKFKEDIFRVENLQYDLKKDEYLCPAGRKMPFVRTKKFVTDNGFTTERRLYECEDCSHCDLREKCHTSKYNRTIQSSPNLKRFKEQARVNLLSQRGEALRKKRGVEVESVFGQIKQNMQFRRFSLRGMENVELEWGLISLGHNFKKLSSIKG